MRDNGTQRSWFQVHRIPGGYTSTWSCWSGNWNWSIEWRKDLCGVANHTTFISHPNFSSFSILFNSSYPVLRKFIIGGRYWLYQVTLNSVLVVRRCTHHTLARRRIGTLSFTFRRRWRLLIWTIWEWIQDKASAMGPLLNCITKTISHFISSNFVVDIIPTVTLDILERWKPKQTKQFPECNE